MKVLLVCNQGMSTGMLVERMKEFGDENDYVEAVPVTRISKVIEDFDVVLIGPQIRYKFDEINQVVQEHKKVVEMVEMSAYGMMDGKAVMAQAKALYEGR
ncbi:MAG: PTS sugar transporter subunit IIB [Longicatena sp.]